MSTSQTVRTNQEPIFVGGAGRSGTTLLRVILDSHPRIACGPELRVIPLFCNLWGKLQTAYLPTLQESQLDKSDINRIFANAIGALLEKNRRATGKARAAEKSPNNVFMFTALHCMFPDSPLIHMIRDGRDVVCSLLTMSWADPLTGKRLSCTENAAEAAKFWVAAVRKGLEAARHSTIARHYHELKYEDLVTRPEPVLRELFEFLDEPWDPVVLEFYKQKRNLASESSAGQVARPLYASACGRWCRDLREEDKPVVKEAAGDLLIELGYASDKDW